MLYVGSDRQYMTRSNVTEVWNVRKMAHYKGYLLPPIWGDKLGRIG